MIQYIALKSHDNQATETLILNENGSGVPLGNASAYAVQWGQKTGSKDVSYQVTDSAGAVVVSKRVAIALKPPAPLTATLTLDTGPSFFGVLEALQQYIDNCHDAECVIDEDSIDDFRNKLAAVEGFRDQLDSVLASLAVEQDQAVVVSEVEVGIPRPTHVELHLSGSPEFSKYSRKVRELEGKYSECRGWKSNERFVTLPWTAEGRELADRLVEKFGSSSGRTTAIIRGVGDFNGRHVPSGIIVRYVETHVEGGRFCDRLLKDYESAFVRHFPDCLVGV